MFDNLKNEISKNLISKGCTCISTKINTSENNSFHATYTIETKGISIQKSCTINIQLYFDINSDGLLKIFFSNSNPRGICDNAFETILTDYIIYDDNNNFTVSKDNTQNRSKLLNESSGNILLEVQCKINNKKYLIHKSDADSYPSNSHAHVDNKKVHLDTGEYYTGSCATGKYMHQKEFARLRHELQTKGVYCLKIRNFYIQAKRHLLLILNS